MELWDSNVLHSRSRDLPWGFQVLHPIPKSSGRLKHCWGVNICKKISGILRDSVQSVRRFWELPTSRVKRHFVYFFYLWNKCSFPASFGWGWLSLNASREVLISFCISEWQCGPTSQFFFILWPILEVNIFYAGYRASLLFQNVADAEDFVENITFSFHAFTELFLSPASCSRHLCKYLYRVKS